MRKNIVERFSERPIFCHIEPHLRHPSPQATKASTVRHFAYPTCHPELISGSLEKRKAQVTDSGTSSAKLFSTIWLLSFGYCLKT